MTGTPYTTEQLHSRSPLPTYRGRSLDEIAFPLGGIGTGMVSLGGWGQLRDWEIQNRPAKGRTLENAYFSVAWRSGDEPAQARVLQGPVGGSHIAGGHGVFGWTGSGLPRFREVEFAGAFPFATVTMTDTALPVSVKLEAWNPFIPLNDADSSIPVAILSYTITNRSDRSLELLLAGNLPNIVGEQPGRTFESRAGGGIAGISFSNSALATDSPQFGTLCLSAVADKVLTTPRWPESNRHLRTARLWQALSELRLPDSGAEPNGDSGSIGVRLSLAANESATVPFIIGWHFPNFEHWKKAETDSDPGGACDCGEKCDCGPAVWRNYYATLYPDAWAAASYVGQNLKRLERETRAFQSALLESTLPTHVLDAVSSQISILKSPTCLRLTDGTFYGFEGCSGGAGCCEGTCTHVWNYAQALPYLFPRLQRSVHDAQFANSMMEDGAVEFRLPLPLGKRAELTFHPAADGQMGSVMQVYREWLISGDRAWLTSVWQQTKRMLEFAWKYWDADRDGVMEGMQHNTYDIEFHGPNTMTGSLYLGALRAAAELAEVMGETETAATYRELAAAGAKWCDKHLFNGEYYEQEVRVGMEAPWPEDLRERALARGRDSVNAAWPQWQYGSGCLSDQLIGQWYARMLDLGDLYDPKHVKAALESVVKYNWRSDLSDHPGLFRVYALGDDAGLLLASWPRGGRPGHGFYFADEVWCGIEYQVASHLIHEGLVDEGLSIAKGVRDRHRGDRRNPWDEFECGHHYARSMASYGLLLALSEFHYNGAKREIGIDPRVFADGFKVFFSVEGGWGVIGRRAGSGRTELFVDLRYGEVTLGRITVPAVDRVGSPKPAATLGDQALACTLSESGDAVVLQAPCVVSAGSELTVTL